MTIADIRGSIKGRVDGVAVEAGSVGEKITGTILNPTLTAAATANAGSIVLTAGVWMIYGKVVISAAGTSKSYHVSSISATTATEDDETYSNIQSDLNTVTSIVCNPKHVNTTGATYYLTVRTSFTGTAPTVTSAKTTFYAIRIA